MLITFKTRANYPSITMFGDVALKLLKFMGRRDTVPSAMDPEDIPAALDSLRKAIAVDDEKHAADPQHDEDEKDRPVSLHNRAVPLIELLEAARDEELPVMWEEGGRKY